MAMAAKRNDTVVFELMKGLLMGTLARKGWSCEMMAQLRPDDPIFEMEDLGKLGESLCILLLQEECVP